MLYAVRFEPFLMIAPINSSLLIDPVISLNDLVKFGFSFICYASSFEDALNIVSSKKSM